MSEQIITKRCCTCKEIKPLSEFYKEATRKDGHQNYCKTCFKHYKQSDKGKAVGRKAKRKYRKTEGGKDTEKCYAQSEKGKANNRKAQNQYKSIHPEKIKAHSAVKLAIKDGKLPPAKTRLCHYCPKPAQEYHHNLGYEPEHWLDVVPVCIKCHKLIHRQRSSSTSKSRNSIPISSK